jgi:hypothetical protein
VGGGKGKKTYTTGYRYYASVHMVLCQGSVVVRKTYVGDKDIGLAGGDGWYWVDKYSLFGGEDAEGGVYGSLYIQTDGLNDDAHGHLESLVGGPAPRYRGVTSVFLYDLMLCAVNPYPKPWRFCVYRAPKVDGMSGYIDVISGKTVNPAAVIAECLLNEEWGLCVPPGDVDMQSFTSCASVLRSEGFGLAIRWDQNNTLEDFIGEICQIIDAQLMMDPVSGKYALKLIRQDYNAASLLELGPSDVLELSDFSRPDPKDLVNQVSIIFEDCNTGVQQSITEQNTAALLLNPAVNAVQLTYPGIPTQALARRVALRELAQYSTGLARCTITANRKAATLKMGDCFKLSWPDLGFEGMVMRVTNFQQGQSDDWRVRLECVQDIYALPDTVFDESEAQTGWKAPDSTPVNISRALVYELPYYLVSWLVTGDRDSSWSDLPEGFGFAAVNAVQPAGLATGYDVNIQDYSQNNAWTPNRRLAFCDYGYLAQGVDDLATELTLRVGSIYQVDVNEPALVDGEWMAVKSWNSATGRLAVGRGAMDTVPAAHSKDAVVWLPGMYDNVVNHDYVTGQSMTTILTTVTTTGQTPLGTSPSFSLAFRNRAGRPIPPANLRVDDVYRPTSLPPWAGTFRWDTRDRRDTTRLWDDRSGVFAPEEGTTYTVQIRERLFAASGWFTVSTTTGLTAPPLDLSGKYTPQARILEITAWSMLDSLESWQRGVITFSHTPHAPEALSMTEANPSASGRQQGDLFINPAGSANPGWYRTWRGSAFVLTQPANGERVTCNNKTYLYTDGWSEEEDND